MTTKQGLYQVGEKSYHNKTDALVEATRTNQHPSWDFSPQVFKSFNWESPITTSLSDLYVERCRQLRDTYDYLILNYSGGSDSWTILNTFLKNNIKLDEIFVYWPIKALQGKYSPNSTNKHASNFMSEWDFVLKPDLDYLKVHHPEIKITVQDYSDNLDSDLSEDIFYLGGHHINVGFFPRQTANLRAGEQYNENRNVCIIVGLDKPQIHISDNSIYGYFIDILSTTSMINTKESNRSIELFYWTPDLPQLPIKSAQEVAMFLKVNPHLQRLFMIGNLNSGDKSLKDNIIRSIVYPNWDGNKFQSNKNTSIFASETDTWIRTHYQDKKFYQAWKHYTSGFINQIDKKYLKLSSTGSVEEYVGFISPLYKICNL